MADIPIEQALFYRSDENRPRLQARSTGFHCDWLTEVEALILGYGDRPAGLKWPQAVFAHPLGNDLAAIVHVADQNSLDPAGRLMCGFHFLVLPLRAYEQFLGDPFAVARLLPPCWHTRGSLPTCSLPAVPLPPRTVRDIQNVLQRLKADALPEDQDPLENTPVRSADNSESPALLGGVQVLVDGGRVVFERAGADSGLIPALCTLLPSRSRCQL